MRNRIVILAMLVLGLSYLPARAAEAPASQPSSKPAADTVIEATDQEALKAAAGETVTVHGKVATAGATRSGSIFFINFEGANRNFAVVIKKEHLEAVNGGFNGDLAAAVKGKSINVTGEIKLYKDKPEIEVTTPDQIKVAEEK